MGETPFFIRDEGAVHRLVLGEIVLIAAAGNYVKFYGYDDHRMVRITLDAALAQLPPDKFVQIHRSLAVSLDHLESFTKDTARLVKVPNVEFPISKKYFPKLVEKVRIVQGTEAKKTIPKWRDIINYGPLSGEGVLSPKFKLPPTPGGEGSGSADGSGS